MYETYDKELKALMQGAAVDASPFVWSANSFKGSAADEARELLGLDPADTILDRRLFLYQTLLLDYGFKNDLFFTVDTTYQSEEDYLVFSEEGLSPWEYADLTTYVNTAESALRHNSTVIRLMQLKGLLGRYNKSTNPAEKLAIILHALT